MEKFTVHTGVGVPLRRSNVDTDQIVPAHYLKRVARTGFEDGLFARWREDPGFVLNDPGYAAGSVLVAGPDFGTGSSREHAVWALQQYGFKAVGVAGHPEGSQAIGAERVADVMNDGTEHTVVELVPIGEIPERLVSGEIDHALVAATLEDALALRQRPNLPGTTDERPNWSIPLPLPLGDVFTDPLVSRLIGAMQR